MFELKQVGANSYYIDSPAKIGVYVDQDNAAYLIDSGNDKDAGRKVRQVLERNGWRLEAIVNTHSNADHIGGNCYLQKQTGCKIFANGIEAAFTRHPILEPSFLYGGYPPKDLRHKFLLAQASDVLDFSDSAFPSALEILPLPGHFFSMTGLRTPDGVVFLADCISSKETLDKYGVAFIYDVEAYLQTLDIVERLEAACFVPAHTEACTDVKDLVRYNRDKVFEVADKLLGFCRMPAHFEAILQQVFRHYHLTLNFEQYVLVGSTIRSYLSWLKDNDKLSVRFEDNLLLWQST